MSCDRSRLMLLSCLFTTIHGTVYSTARGPVGVPWYLPSIIIIDRVQKFGEMTRYFLVLLQFCFPIGCRSIETVLHAWWNIVFIFWLGNKTWCISNCGGLLKNVIPGFSLSFTYIDQYTMFCLLLRAVVQFKMPKTVNYWFSIFCFHN